MDPRCQERAEIIEQWIDELARAEEISMNLENSEEAAWARLFLGADGNVKEREAKVNSNPEMIELRENIKNAKIEAKRVQRMLDLSIKAGDWEYGTIKRDEAAIQRQRGIT